jgi:PAS domain S-box-containing protein
VSGAFFSHVVSPSFDELFEHLPDVYLFVKNVEGRFVRANRAFVKLVRANTEADVVGESDTSFFPLELAEDYRRDDQQVMASREPMVDKAELVRNRDGSIDWFCTTKLPMLDEQGEVIGVCGMTRDVKRMREINARFESWTPVIETMLRDYAKPLSIVELAGLVPLSQSAFSRQFKQRFHVTPRAYLTGVRLSAARHLLVSTELSVGEVASQTGFYDQSHFTHQFVKSYGITPGKYRSRLLGTARPSAVALTDAGKERGR